MKSLSFFDRLSGTPSSKPSEPARKITPIVEQGDSPTNEPLEGELAIDMVETPREYIVRAMLAGVHTNDVDLATTRDSLTIRGTRTDEKHGTEGSYVYRELYWGAFSRTITFAEEIEPEEVSAFQNQGLLTVVLPKVDRDRVQKIRVRTSDK